MVFGRTEQPVWSENVWLVKIARLRYRYLYCMRLYNLEVTQVCTFAVGAVGCA